MSIQLGSTNTGSSDVSMVLKNTMLEFEDSSVLAKHTRRRRSLTDADMLEPSSAEQETQDDLSTPGSSTPSTWKSVFAGSSTPSVVASSGSVCGSHHEEEEERRNPELQPQLWFGDVPPAAVVQVGIEASITVGDLRSPGCTPQHSPQQAPQYASPAWTPMQPAWQAADADAEAAQAFGFFLPPAAEWAPDQQAMWWPQLDESNVSPDQFAAAETDMNCYWMGADGLYYSMDPSAMPEMAPGTWDEGAEMDGMHFQMQDYSMLEITTVPVHADDHKTTVMIRNLPAGYTRDMLIELIDSEGFRFRYDFAYLPVDFGSGVSLGYGFINLLTHDDAEEFFEHFGGFSNWQCGSDAVCSVSWGEPCQGLEAHVERYRNSPVMHGSVPDSWKPILLRRGETVEFPVPTKKIKAPKIRSRPESFLKA